MKNKNVWVVIVAIVVVAAIIVGIRLNQQKEEVVKVGAILPLTGSGAELGEYSRDAILLAEQLINKSDGVLGKKIKVIIQDNRSLPKEGLSATQQILNVNPDIKVIFSQLSGVAVTISPLLKDEKILHFSMAATPKFLEVSPFNIRNYLSAESIADMAVTYVGDELKQKKAGVLYMEAEYSSPIAENYLKGCNKRGIEVESFTFPQDPDVNLARSIIAKLFSKIGKQGTIFLTGYGPSLGLAARELGTYGFDGTLIVEPTFNFPDALKMVENAKFRIVLIDISFSSSNPSNDGQRDFVEMYKEKYNREPKLSAALIYETIFLWKLTVEKVHSFDSQIVIDQMPKLGEIKGHIFPEISVDDRDIKFPLTYKNIVAGKVL